MKAEHDGAYSFRQRWSGTAHENGASTTEQTYTLHEVERAIRQAIRGLIESGHVAVGPAPLSNNGAMA